MSDDLTRAIAEALGCERQEASFGTFCRKHQYRRWATCESEASMLAAALAPLIEARVREAWDEGYNDGLKDTEERLPNPYGEGIEQGCTP